MNRKDLSLKPKKFELICGTISFLFSIFIMKIYWEIFLENERGISNFLISSMFLALPLILIGIVLYVLYFRRCMQMKQAVTAYGADQIQSHLLYANIKVCNASITKEVATFFTEQFIYQKNKCVIDYNMIDVMFREDYGSNGGYKGITLLLLDGTEVRTCYEWIIFDFVDICFHRCHISREIRIP